MKIFDMHNDMGTNLYERYLNSEDNVFESYHLTNLQKGEVKGLFCACFFSGEEDYKYMQNMILHANEVLDRQKEVVKVSTSSDLKESDKIHILISVEGMCVIKDDVENQVDWLYKHNVKVASLVWNEENALASGWPNNPLNGLSKLGKRVVKKMNELKMIIDVSHINEKGFWDIVELSDMPIIATHSNARALCNHQRNLTDQQIKAIGLKGGLIGLNAARHFISDIEEECTAYTLAKHGKYIADLIGVDHVAIGFDYMDFLNDYGQDSMALDLTDASYSQNLVLGLKQVGFNEEEIAKICYKNVEDFLMKYL